MRGRRAVISQTSHRRQGFILLPVALVMALVAVLAFLMNRESGMGMALVAREARTAEAYYVAKAGLQHANWLMQNAGCTGYPSLSSVSFAGSSYDVTVTPTDGSPVTLTSTTTLADGTSRALTRTGVPIYQAPTTLPLQPDAATGKDTYLYEWKSSWNYGAAGEVYVSNEWSDSEAHSLLRFDLDGIPHSAAVQSAVLELYQHSPSASGGTIGVRRLSSDWGEGAGAGNTGAGANWQESDTGLAWSTPGGDYDPKSFASSVLPAGAIGWFPWDVTELVAGWVGGTSPNHGLLLVPVTPNTGAYFRSSDYSDPALHPKLTITYACECGVGCDGGPTRVLSSPRATASTPSRCRRGGRGSASISARTSST
jgi:Tfp pilus assembly protein PilX